MRFLTTALLFFAVHAQAQTQQRIYKSLKETVGLSYNSLASVCPRDGATPCTGSLAGWTWATKEQVAELFQKYQPDFTIGGINQYPMAGYFYAEGVISEVKSTYSFFITYQTYQYTGGLTSSIDENGIPYLGEASAGSTNVSFSGGLAIYPSGSVSQSSPFIGAFLWRDASIPLPVPPKVIKAEADSRSVNPGGVVANFNILANDRLGGVVATLETVNLSQVSASDSDISLDLASGSVSLSSSAAIGAHTLEYKICEKAFPDNCSSAIVSIQVNPNRMYAGADAANGSKKTPAILVPNVLHNDMVGSRYASLQSVILTQVSATSLALQLNTSTGAVSLKSKVDGGTYGLTYRICERANPTNCASTTVTLYLK